MPAVWKCHSTTVYLSLVFSDPNPAGCGGTSPDIQLWELIIFDVISHAILLFHLGGVVGVSNTVKLHQQTYG